MTIDHPKCACGCGAVLVRVGRRGPAPQYASAVCRKRAERHRRTDAVELPDPVKLERPVAELRPVDDQVQRALLEARAVAFAFIRLGGQARPELAWRCEVLGKAIVEKLGETFGKDIVE